MSLLIVSTVLEITVLLAVGLGLAAWGFALAARVAGRQSARAWLGLSRAILVASLILPPLARVLLRPEALFSAPVQVWSGEARRPVRLALTGFAPASAARGTRAVPELGAGTLGVLAAALLSAGALGLLRLLRDGRRSWRLCRTATTIRRRGRLRICVSERAAVPFSAWTGRRTYIVVPEHFVLAPGHLRVALLHELTHVRAGDIVWVFAPALLRALMPWNPAATLWARWLSRLDELACDEQVLGRQIVSPRAYGECLLWAAEAACTPSRPVLAVPMLGRSRTFLERRITMLLDPAAPKRRSLIPLTGVAVLAVLCLTSALARGAIADRRLGAAEVRAIADDLDRATGFHVTVDASVVDEVNLVVSRPEARSRFREGLERLAAYRSIGGEALRLRGIPEELLAIPQTESRVRPLPEEMNRMRSAGIWQFIPATARRYGLRVDETMDERMDPRRAAEAAAALLADLHEEFQDWRLAVAAYNAGAEKVRRAIAENGTSDPVALVEAGAISRYASAVMAAALLIHRPGVLD